MEKIPYFDAHCDTLSRCEKLGQGLRENDGHLDLRRLGAFDRAAQIFAIFHDAAKAPEGGMHAECRRQRELYESELQRCADAAAPCRTAVEVERANASGRIAALLSCEGAELLDCDPAKLAWSREAGVVSVNLTWNHANALAGAHCDQPERGLSERGKDFVREAGRQGILIDVSHCSDAAFWDLMRLTERPVVATHSNARALCPHTRNLTDDMFRALAETGGVAGVNLYARFVAAEGDAPMDALLRHFDRYLALGGAKHICLGGDLDGCEMLAGGIGGVQDLPRLWTALRAHGCDRALLEDVFYNNLLRVLN